MSLENKKVLCIAHRGAYAYAPENTLKSFKTAIEMGADMIELDVHLTKDRQVVVLHDDTIDRTSDGSGYVWDYTLEELKAFDFGEGEKIPTLAEVFELVKGKVGVNVEIKQYNMEREIVDVIRKYNMEKDVIISSFLHPTLVNIKNLEPTLKTALLFTARPVNVARLAKEARAEFLHPYFETTDEIMIKEAISAGIGVNVWTVDEEEDIERMIKMGATGIITDVPDICIEVRERLMQAKE
ncbi:MAG: glycerophosphodiester phosphodiesterase [Candidatus Odinarchaeota archaeon]|nr:glycerophosphodiester phosphodiesterase [Candidatus Odinarchaeota archaeon]